MPKSSKKTAQPPPPKQNPNLSAGVEDPADNPGGVAEMGGQGMGSSRKDGKKKPASS